MTIPRLTLNICILIFLGASGYSYSMNTPKKSTPLIDLEYIQGFLDNPDFYNEQGWAREPLSHYLQIPQDLAWALFPDHDPELCITAKIGTVAIGHRMCNRFELYVKKMNENLKKFKSIQEYQDAPIKKYFEILDKVLEAELALEQELTEKNILPEMIVNNAGIMVLKDYEGFGIARTMQNESIKLLKSKGFKAVIAKTTNIKSAMVMANNGFMRFAHLPYKDFNVDLNDGYTIWYKLLSDN